MVLILLILFVLVVQCAYYFCSFRKFELVIWTREHCELAISDSYVIDQRLMRSRWDWKFVADERSEMFNEFRCHPHITKINIQQLVQMGRRCRL